MPTLTLPRWIKLPFTRDCEIEDVGDMTDAEIVQLIRSKHLNPVTMAEYDSLSFVEIP